MALIVLLTHCVPSPLTPNPQPTRTPIAPAAAVQFALEALHTDGITGHLIGEPSILRGQVMSLADAYALVNGKPPPPTSPLARRRDRAVWLVVTRGDWLLHIPGAHGDPVKGIPTIMATNKNVSNLWNAIYFDAATGEIHEEGGILPTQLPEMDKLPQLPGL